MAAADALAWARKHVAYRYLFEDNLVGRLWASEHAALVTRLERDHPERFAALEQHILVPWVVPLMNGLPYQT